MLTGPRPPSRRAFLFLWPFRLRNRVKLAGIEFEVLRKGTSKRRYLLIHGDEETARQVLRRHMKSNAGIAHLVTGHKREVALRGGLLDPNRMFSREGADRNLKLLNPDWTPARINASLDALDRGRGKLISALTLRQAVSSSRSITIAMATLLKPKSPSATRFRSATPPTRMNSSSPRIRPISGSSPAPPTTPSSRTKRRERTTGRSAVSWPNAARVMRTSK